MKKKIIVIGTIFMLLVITLAPSINAISINNNEQKEEDPIFFGVVQGTVTTAGWPPLYPINGAKLDLISDTGKRVTYSGIFGGFRFLLVPFGKYDLTVSHPYYESETKSFKLERFAPNKDITFELISKNTRSKSVVEPKNLDSILENTEINVELDDSGLFGRVSGMIITSGFLPQEISGAKLELKGGLTKRITFSGILGMYRFNFVPFGPYDLTVSHPHYETETASFNLIPTEANKIISFSLYEKETRSKTTEEPARLGSIWGNTGESSGHWGFSPVGLVKVEAGGKSTYSSPILGCYKIRNLPPGTYTVTGTKNGYETRTETVKLTEERPDQQCFIHMEPNDENVNIIKPASYGLITEKVSKTLEKVGYGLVLGSTLWAKNWCMGELPGVRVVAIGEGLPRVKNSNIFAHFQFILPLDRTYTISGSKEGYNSDSETVTLTSDEPLQFVDLVLRTYGNNVDVNEKTNTVKSTTNENNNEPTCFGTIMGKTGTNMWSGWCPVNRVKIDIGTRTKYSNPHFFFTGLALDKTYTVTASKPGWKTETREVTLTKDNPIENIWFELDDNGDNNAITEKPACMGYIHGSVGNSQGLYYWEAYPFALVDAEVKQTKCGPLGLFRMFIPYGTYNVTAYYKGYKSLTKEVTLTEQYPERQLYFDFYDANPANKDQTDIIPKTTKLSR